MKICPTCKAEYAGGEVFCPVDATRLSTPSQMHEPQPQGADPLVGTTLNERYRIVGRIGEGGMGIVYEAEHVVIEKRVALKVLREDFSSRPEVVERFRQEAKSASRIGHQHIVDISDFGETPSKQSYFVMEYLKGEDLANLLAREGTVAPERAVKIALQCCRALGAAHGKGIVHRDMKPENVFLIRRDDDEAEDFVKIVDFGIAKMSDIETEGAPGRKLTKTGMIFGTPEYMSPEQAAGKSLDHRVDVYALGAILFEMLTGQVPFVGDSFMGILTHHMFEPVPALREVNPNVQVSAELETVIMGALTKEPDERYANMDELARDLQVAMGWAKGEPTHPGFGRTVASSQPGVRRVGLQATSDAEFPATGEGKRLRVGMIAAAAVAAVAIGSVGAWYALRPEASTADTEPTE
ncbi:MAG: serine/threonine-protein kinase, partial [Polyangiales bacterium]